MIIVLAAATIAALGEGAISPQGSGTVPANTELSSEKQVVTELFAECFNRGRFENLPNLVGPSYQGPNGQSGPSAFGATIAGIRAALPDVYYTLNDLVAENERVAARWHLEGTQDGPFRGFPATHKHVTSTGMAIFQFKDGKIVASWLQTDQLGFLQQIGALPHEINPRLPH
jgi:steroid delta-isomerase-like uncharacterized protein